MVLEPEAAELRIDVDPITGSPPGDGPDTADRGRARRPAGWARQRTGLAWQTAKVNLDHLSGARVHDVVRHTQVVAALAARIGASGRRGVGGDRSHQKSGSGGGGDQQLAHDFPFLSPRSM